MAQTKQNYEKQISSILSELGLSKFLSNITKAFSNGESETVEEMHPLNKETLLRYLYQLFAICKLGYNEGIELTFHNENEIFVRFPFSGKASFFLGKGEAIEQIEARVKAFNSRYKVGDTLQYGEKEVTIKAPASILGGHSAVVWFNEIPNCISIDSVINNS